MIKKEELNKGSLSVPLKVEYDTVNLALHNAEDVATMRQVLLQISNWFKSKHKTLPFTLKDPFNDDTCNDMYGYIFDLMKDETKEEEA